MRSSRDAEGLYLYRRSIVLTLVEGFCIPGSPCTLGGILRVQKFGFCQWCAHTMALVRNSNAPKDRDSESKLAPIISAASSRLLLPDMVGIRPKVVEVTAFPSNFGPIRTWESDMYMYV